MEINELKAKWDQMSQLLNETKVLNHQVLNEILKAKIHSALDVLRNIELIGLVVLFIVLLPVIYIQFLSRIPLQTAFIALADVILSISILWQICKLMFISKISLDSMSTVDIASRINRYRLWLKCDMIISSTIVIAIGIFTILYRQLYLYPSLLILMFVVIIIAFVIEIYCYKRNNKAIQAINNTLEELRELK